MTGEICGRIRASSIIWCGDVSTLRCRKSDKPRGLGVARQGRAWVVQRKAQGEFRGQIDELSALWT